MNPYSRAFSRHVGMLMLAKDGGESGGGTLKAQLETAEQERDTEKARADQAEKDFKSEQEAHGTTKASLQKAEKGRNDEKARADKAEEDLKAETEAHETTAEELTELKAKDTTATGKAQEALAKHRIAPGIKQAPKTLAAEPVDGAQLHEEYSKLKGAARAKFFAKHKEALMAHAEANPPEDEEED